MTKQNLAALTISVLLGACAVEDASSPDADPREGTYSVQSEVDVDAINSEVYRDGVLIAVVTLDARQEVVTLVDSGKELVAAPPDDYDPRTQLDLYHDTLVALSTGLALTEVETEVQFRNACSYMLFDGENGSQCAVSWCSDGSSCTAIDCGPNIWGAGELHIMNGCD